jgi:hypothetical protein
LCDIGASYATATVVDQLIDTSAVEHGNVASSSAKDHNIKDRNMELL